jgi:hypothetical protein
MEVSIDELLSGLGIKYNNIEYKSTKEYIKPFLYKLEGIATEYRIYAIPYKQTIIDNNTKYIVYTKVNIQAFLPNNQVIGMVYSIDSKLPTVKFYSGVLNEYSYLCIPLKIFYCGFNNIYYDEIPKFINTYNPKHNYIERLKCIPFKYSDNNILKCLGSWIRKSLHQIQYNNNNKVKLGVNIPINAFKMLTEIPTSNYYITKDSNMYNVYNAFLKVINNNIGKDPLNIYEKTLLVQRILDLPKLV